MYAVSSTVSCSSAAASVGGRHAELGEDRRDRQRVRDVRVAAAALLARCAPLGDVVGALDRPRRSAFGWDVAHGPEQRLEQR